jgi:hypothetical protein
MISHMCACVWILIGEAKKNGINENQENQGWIIKLIDEGMLNDEYWSKYICAFYWVITTFSSIGYGDVIGNTNTENLFTMFVEMMGICFFGYIIGLF